MKLFITLILFYGQLMADEFSCTNYDGGPDCGASNECYHDYGRSDGPHAGSCHSSAVGAPGANGVAILVDFEKGANGPDEFMAR